MQGIADKTNVRYKKIQKKKIMIEVIVSHHLKRKKKNIKNIKNIDAEVQVVKAENKRRSIKRSTPKR